MPTKEATLEKIEDKLIFAERLVKLMNDSFTKKEFLDAFEKVVDIVLQIKALNKEEMEEMKKMHKEMMHEVESGHKEGMEKMDKKLDAFIAEKTALIEQKMMEVKDGKDADEKMMMEQMMAEMMPKHETMMKEMEEKMMRMFDDLPQQIREKLLPLLIEDIKGLREELEELRRLRPLMGGRMFGGGTSTIGVQAALGRIEVIDEEVSFSGTTGTLANRPGAGSVKLYRGGVRMQLGTGKDYTISGNTITLATAAITGEIFLVDYRKA